MYSQWNSIGFEDLNDVPYLTNFTENVDGLLLHCNFKSGNKLIHFTDYLALRIIDEGNAFKTLEQQNFDGKSWFFVASDSDFIDWFNDQSCSIHENQYKHYIVVTQHKILELLSSEKPSVIVDWQNCELVENANWHINNLKAKIIRAYSKELKGSKNFDFYRDPKTGDVFIQGNKSKDMIQINLEQFLAK